MNDPLALGVQRSISGRRWIWREGEARTGLAIAQRLGLDEVVARLLAARGVGIEDAADFLDPTLRALLPDPSRLIDMDVAAERLARAARGGETVAVFGDYDVDGACSAALMATLLRALGCAVLPYVPDRIAEGYGPNLPALRGLVAQGATLVVCVDCGTAAGVVLEALEGAEVIVLDHHTAEGPPPRVVATVNPNRLDCGSGQKMLCATAVAFLAGIATVRSLRRAGHFEGGMPEPDLLGLLDLVALATVCDVMPLVGVNRALVTQGLRVMQRRERPGIAALLEVAAVKDRVSAMTLGFALGPRINAGGRIGEAGLGLRLLLSDDTIDARAMAATLDAVNRQRQTVEAGMLSQAMEAAEAQLAAGHATVLVSGAEWHPGVVGIVAGRIKERFNRPALVAGVADGIAKGSGRSVTGIDLGAAVIAARQAGLLATGGGHPMAAGFSLSAGRMAEFHAFLDARLAAASGYPAAADLVVEGAASVAGCTLELAASLARLAPFGNGNAEPTLVLARCRIVRAERIGKELTTVRAFLEGEGGGPRLKAVMFRAKDGPLAPALLERGGAALHVAGHLRAEEWNGRVSTSFIITDLAET